MCKLESEKDVETSLKKTEEKVTNSSSWCGKVPDVMQFIEKYVLCVLVDPTSAPVASGSEASSPAAPEAATLCSHKVRKTTPVQYNCSNII